jgi:hypothetical protein
MTTDMGSQKAAAHAVLLLTLCLFIAECHSTAITFPQVTKRMMKKIMKISNIFNDQY